MLVKYMDRITILDLNRNYKCKDKRIKSKSRFLAFRSVFRILFGGIYVE